MTKKVEKFDQVWVKRAVPQMARLLVVLQILYHEGGVAMKEDLLLTEALDWMSGIDSNPYVNRLNRTTPTEVIGFYDPRYSSERVQYPTEEEVNRPFKYIRNATALDSTLVAARPQARLLREVIDQLSLLMVDPIERLKKWAKEVNLDYILSPSHP